MEKIFDQETIEYTKQQIEEMESDEIIQLVIDLTIVVNSSTLPGLTPSNKQIIEVAITELQSRRVTL